MKSTSVPCVEVEMMTPEELRKLDEKILSLIRGGKADTLPMLLPLLCDYTVVTEKRVRVAVWWLLETGRLWSIAGRLRVPNRFGEFCMGTEKPGLRPSDLTFVAEALGRLQDSDNARSVLIRLLGHEAALVREGAIYGLSHHLND